MARARRMARAPHDAALRLRPRLFGASAGPPLAPRGVGIAGTTLAGDGRRAGAWRRALAFDGTGRFPDAGARRRHARACLDPARRRGRSGAQHHRSATRGGAAARLGRLSVDDRRLWRPRRAIGSTREPLAPDTERGHAAARGRAGMAGFGARPACRSIFFASPASTGRAATSSSRCATARRGASSSRARSSTASMSTTSPACSRPRSRSRSPAASTMSATTSRAAAGCGRLRRGARSACRRRRKSPFDQASSRRWRRASMPNRSASRTGASRRNSAIASLSDLSRGAGSAPRRAQARSLACASSSIVAIRSAMSRGRDSRWSPPLIKVRRMSSPRRA